MGTGAWESYISGIPPFSQERLDELRKKVGIELPDDYIADLKAHPGMLRKESAVQVLRRRTAVGSLLYIGGEHGQENYTYSVENSLERLAEWAKGFEEVEAMAFWPFAKDLGQGAFCLTAKTGSGDAPKVVHVDRELDPDEEHAVIPLAGSYGEFMASLTAE